MIEAELDGPNRSLMAKPGASNVLFMFLVALGGVFGLTGLALRGQTDDSGIAQFLANGGGAALVLGVLGMTADRVARSLRARRGPMAADYAWPQDGVQRVGTLPEAACSVAVIAVFAALGGILPGIFVGMGADVTLVLFVIFAPMGGFVGFLIGGGPLVMYRRYGPSRLKLPSGPVFPGSTVLAELESRADLSRAEMELRCVREDVVGTGKQAKVVKTRTALGRVAERQATTAGLQFALVIPEDAAPCALSANPAVYWELFVKDEAAEFEGYFLVPVYPRPPLSTRML